MLSLGAERLPTPTTTKKFWIITCTTIWICYDYYGVFLLIYSSQNTQITPQNLISSSLYYPGPLHKISSQSVCNVLSNVVHKQTNKQTDNATKQTNATKNITSFAKEVISEQNNIIIVVAYPDRGAGNDPKLLFCWGDGGVVFHHQGSTFLQWAIWG